MSNIDKQAVQAVADLKAGYTLGHADVAILNELARIALASLEAEPVCVIDQSNLDYLKSGADADVWPASRAEMGDVLLYRTTPPAPVSVPDDIDTRMKNAGMLSAAEIIAGQPIDAFMKHAGVVDLESLLKWSEMRRAEFLRMQAKYELGDNQKDDMYEWVISHVAAFSELHVNIRAAMLQGADGNSPVIPDDVRRMDWLVSKTVDVREPMVYGSHSLFWSQTITDEEDDYHATKLREQIDAAMAAERAAAPKQEAK
ncbi:hypothetical protein QCD67_06560 [Enterobacter roggenkampii]|uniref:hypothetical protein n=1 Tax=Enterobacter roggenkampii TaxID=1812935 RepID=UPI00244C589A|nr:hypothetical protein [Enterobacter roggenkampii]WGG56879.1 hypothetical protein QCD67_06560 [Enterobacter roggenkampii]